MLAYFVVIEGDDYMGPQEVCSLYACNDATIDAQYNRLTMR